MMITDRPLDGADYDTLVEALAKDVYHTGTTPEFFVQPGTLTKVFELDGKPIIYTRATKCLRLDLQFVDNDDARNNIKVMLASFPRLAEQAKANGFTEIVFCTSSVLLEKFCIKKLGFEQIEGHELRKAL